MDFLSILETLGIILLNVIVGSIIVLVSGSMAYFVLKDLVGNELDLKNQFPLFTVVALSNIVLIFVWGPADNGGPTRALAFIVGIVATVTTCRLLWRIQRAYSRNLKQRQEKYWTWYQTLSTEQKLLEEIRQNTLQHARELERIRNKLRNQ